MKVQFHKQIAITVLNTLILLLSIVLYSFWGEGGLPVLGIFFAISYFFGILLYRWKRKKKLFLLLGCTLAIVLFVWLKYLAFQRERDILATGVQTSFLSVWNHFFFIGFLLLHTIQYLTDVYKGDIKAVYDPFAIAVYISMLSFIPVRPVLQYTDIQKQIRGRKLEKKIFFLSLTRFAKGLVKKFIFAAEFAIIADNIFVMSKAGHLLLPVPMLTAWIGIFAFTLQIYYSFSGYTDIAIGIAGIFGFHLENDFKKPYQANSLVDFWKRWEKSLGDFFRKHLYGFIIQGFKDTIAHRFYIYFLLWIVCGAWFGFGVKFLIWSIANALALAVDITVYSDKDKDGLHILRTIFMWMIILSGWLLLRSEDLYHFKEYFGNLFLQNNNGFANSYTWMFIREYIWIWAAGIWGCFRIKGYTDKYILMQNIKKFVYITALPILAAVSVLYAFQREIGYKMIPGGVKYTMLEGYGAVQKIMGKHEIGSFAVVKDKKGVLYASSFWNGFGADQRKIAQEIRGLKDSPEAARTAVGMVICPAKMTWKTDGYTGVPYRDDSEIVAEMKSWLDYYSVPVLDLQSMGEEESIGEDFFYTDEEWTPKGAFKGYGKILSWLAEEFKADYDPENFFSDINNYILTKYENIFLGDQGRETGYLFAGRADDYLLIEPEDSGDYNVRYEDGDETEEIRGDFRESFINVKGLDLSKETTYGLYNRKFKGVYLRGTAYPHIFIRNYREGARGSVLLVHDSLGVPVGAFMAQSFREVDMLDISMLQKDDLKKYLKEKQYDYLLIVLGAKQLAEGDFHF